MIHTGRLRVCRRFRLGPGPASRGCWSEIVRRGPIWTAETAASIETVLVVNNPPQPRFRRFGSPGRPPPRPRPAAFRPPGPPPAAAAPRPPPAAPRRGRAPRRPGRPGRPPPGRAPRRFGRPRAQQSSTDQRFITPTGCGVAILVECAPEPHRPRRRRPSRSGRRARRGPDARPGVPAPSPCPYAAAAIIGQRAEGVLRFPEAIAVDAAGRRIRRRSAQQRRAALLADRRVPRRVRRIRQRCGTVRPRGRAGARRGRGRVRRRQRQRPHREVQRRRGSC